MNGVHDARSQVRGKSVVVALIQRKVSQFAILDDVLIEEAVQCPTLCNGQRGKVPVRGQIKLSD